MEEAVRNKSKLLGGTGRGTGKGLLGRAIDSMSKPQVNWKTELRRFIGKLPRGSEDIWRKKAFSRGEYISDDRTKEGAMGNAVMAVDTSGSMGDDELRAILGEIYDIIVTKQIKRTEIVYFDDGIQGIDMVKSKPKFDYTKATGGGGTSFIDPIDHIKMRDKQHKMDLAVFCTDGYGDQEKLDTNPSYKKKFVWLIIDNPGWVAPFGRVIHISSKKK